MHNGHRGRLAAPRPNKGAFIVIRIKTNNPFVFLAVMLICIVGGLTCFAAWVAHAMWAVKLLASGAAMSAGQLVLAVGGTVLPPIGVVHGLLIWFS